MSGIIGTIGAKSGVIGKNEPVWGPNAIGDLTLGTGVTVGSNNSSPASTNVLYKNLSTGLVSCYLEFDDFAINSSTLICTFPEGYIPLVDMYVAATCTCWDAVYLCRLHHNTGNLNMWAADYVGKGEGGRTSTSEAIIFSEVWMAA